MLVAFRSSFISRKENCMRSAHNVNVGDGVEGARASFSRRIGRICLWASLASGAIIGPTILMNYDSSGNFESSGHDGGGGGGGGACSLGLSLPAAMLSLFALQKLSKRLPLQVPAV